MHAPRLLVTEVQLYERPVRLRLPFRFGVVTLTEAPQAFVRVRIKLEDGREAWGAGAELMVPKWFDKNLALSNEDNFNQLRLALALARESYLADTSSRSAFGHFAAHYQPLLAAGERHGLNPLAMSFGPAQLDRAVLDGLCRALDVTFYDVIRKNIAGIVPAALVPELTGFDMDRFLAGLTPAPAIAARHTVGLVDVLTGHPRRVNDGLPESLEEVIAAYGHTWFKLKVGGKVDDDLARLAEIATVLDRAPQYRATLDGNEQYDDLDTLIDLWNRMCAEPRLARLAENVVFIEQPINRKYALARDVSALTRIKPVIIDESDGDLTAFPTARMLGYSGVSSKACKDLYKSLINLARCRVWNDAEKSQRYFMSGEDLTTQAGLCVQQDLALVSLLGLDHVERNGHHYVNGMAGASEIEQTAFLSAHPDLYERRHGAVRLRIQAGRLAIGSLACAGFASAVHPEWETLAPMSATTSGAGSSPTRDP
jgi:hypothetical protein